MRQHGLGIRVQHWDAKELVPAQGVLQGPADSERPVFLVALADDSLGQGTGVDIATFCCRPLVSSGQQSGHEKAWKVMLMPLSYRVHGATSRSGCRCADGRQSLGALPFLFC